MTAKIFTASSPSGKDHGLNLHYILHERRKSDRGGLKVDSRVTDCRFGLGWRNDMRFGWRVEAFRRKFLPYSSYPEAWFGVRIMAHNWLKRGADGRNRTPCYVGLNRCHFSQKFVRRAVPHVLQCSIPVASLVTYRYHCPS
jgi:hypothetical protein